MAVLRKFEIESHAEQSEPYDLWIYERNFFDYQTKLDLTLIGFKMAFSVEGYLDSELKDDPRYVKYIVRIYGKRNDTLYQ